MSRIEELIQDLCPSGVEYEAIAELITRSEKVRWDDLDQTDEFRYIDLGTVDRVTHSINDTETITKENAPSRAQQVVREGDVLFGTTRPMLKRYCIVPADYDGQVASTGFCVLRANTDRILTNFLFHLLGTATFYEYVEANERGASYPAIPDNVVKKFRIPCHLSRCNVRSCESWISSLSWKRSWKRSWKLDAPSTTTTRVNY